MTIPFTASGLRGMTAPWEGAEPAAWCPGWAPALVTVPQTQPAPVLQLSAGLGTGTQH